MPKVTRWPSKELVSERLGKSGFLGYFIQLYQQKWADKTFVWEGPAYYYELVEVKGKKNKVARGSINCGSTNRLELRIEEELPVGEVEQRLAELFKDFPDLSIVVVVGKFSY